MDSYDLVALKSGLSDLAWDGKRGLGSINLIFYEIKHK